MLLELSSISKDANGSADRSIDRAGIGCDRLSDMGSPRRPEVARVDLRDNHGLQSEVLHKNAAEGHVAKSLGAPEVLHKDAEEGRATKDWFQESAAERRERDSEREERARLMAERDKLADLVDTKNLGSQALAEGADEVSYTIPLLVRALTDTCDDTGRARCALQQRLRELTTHHATQAENKRP